MKRKSLCKLLGGVCLVMVVIALLMGGCAKPAPAPAPAPAPEEEGVTIILAQHKALPSMSGYSHAEQFRTTVWKNSDGRIEVKHFPGDLLGDWKVQVAQVREGAIDMSLCPASATFDKQLEFSVVPFVVFTWDGAKNAYQAGSPAAELIETICERNNTHFFGIDPMGFSIVVSAKEFTPMPGDSSITKLKTRVHAKIAEITAQAIGFRTLTMPLSEVHGALMLGTIDAAFGPTYQEARYFTDVAKYVYQITSSFNPPAWIMNLDRWNSLSAEDQNILQTAMDEVLASAWEEAIVGEQEAIKLLEAEGMEIVAITPEQMHAIVQKCRDEVWPWAEENLIGKETMDMVKGFAQPLP
ncbi:MAG TPA: TRAP transporter substrate-binding protein DctP [Dehalococcoidales bacterium]|nr:TRAP transporter substrate-binding protein DctP [Dehalococcoidales bacterium]